MPGSKFRVVAEAKDLNPRKVRLLRYNVPPLDRVNSGVDPAAEGDLTLTDGGPKSWYFAGAGQNSDRAPPW
jgi:hypothetical protein